MTHQRRRASDEAELSNPAVILEQTSLLRRASTWADAEDILERLAKALRGRRSAAEIRLEIAWHYELMQDFEVALGHYARLRRCQFPRLAAAAAYGIARIKWNQGHHSRSVRLYRNLLNRFPDQASAAQAASDIVKKLIRAGDTDGAAEFEERRLQILEKEAGALFLRGIPAAISVYLELAGEYKKLGLDDKAEQSMCRIEEVAVQTSRMTSVLRSKLAAMRALRR